DLVAVAMGVAYAAVRMDRAAVGIAQAKGEQAAAVVQADAGPVPADRGIGHQLARPFVIEPAAAADGVPRMADAQRAACPQAGARIVVARLSGPGPLAG